jgi:hypothetical protein
MRLDLITSHLPELLGSILLGILFIQSSLDKVFDWKGNLGWLSGHFSKTIFAGTVPMMLGVLTVMELATGLLAVAGFIYFLAAASTIVIFYASLLGALTLLALFFGQRVAKDYPGAAVLVPYFILTIIMVYLTRPAA